ncbi:MAG: tetratricopeptide repeat protein, partial [Gemmataceae bacterium]
ALELFEEARRTVVPKLPPDHPFALTVLNNLAWQYRAFGKKAEAIALAERVREAQERTLGPRHPSTIFTLLNLALAHQADRQPQRALPLFRQAAEGVESLNFAHAHAGQILREFCKCLDQLGHREEADRWRKKREAAPAGK